MIWKCLIWKWRPYISSCFCRCKFQKCGIISWAFTSLCIYVQTTTGCTICWCSTRYLTLCCMITKKSPSAIQFQDERDVFVDARISFASMNHRYLYLLPLSLSPPRPTFPSSLSLPFHPFLPFQAFCFILVQRHNTASQRASWNMWVFLSRHQSRKFLFLWS